MMFTVQSGNIFRLGV